MAFLTRIHCESQFVTESSLSLFGDIPCEIDTDIKFSHRHSIQCIHKENKKSMSISALANKMMTTTCTALFNLCFYILREYGICGMYHKHIFILPFLQTSHIHEQSRPFFNIFFISICVCSACSFSNGHTFSLSLHIISPFSIQIRMLHFLYKIQFT